MDSIRYEKTRTRSFWTIALAIAALAFISFQTCAEAASGATVTRVTEDPGGLKLEVDGQDFMVFGMNWGYMPIGENYNYDLSRDASRKQLFWRLFDALRRVEEDTKNHYMQRLKTLLNGHGAEATGEAPGPAAEFLAPDAITNTKREIVQYGAHTVHHVILTRVPEQRAEREIRESIADVRRWSGAEVNTFAYPNGDPHAHSHTHADIDHYPYGDHHLILQFGQRRGPGAYQVSFRDCSFFWTGAR